ncbi:transmembrane protease serine 9-like isoform X2 [Styela clava]
MQLRYFLPLCLLLIGLSLLQQSSCQSDYEYPDYGDEPCSGGITINDASSGTIQSTNYPQAYFELENCTWIIETPNNTRIAVKFSPLFSIEIGSGVCRDYLLIEYGGTTMKMCGSGITPNSFITDTNTMRVNFVSNENIEGAGFSFNWTTIDMLSIPSSQEVTLTENQGTITSPGFPANYQNLLKYSWKLMVDDGKYIVVEFDTNLDIESGTDGRCTYDALRIHKGTTADSSNILKTICTKQASPIVLKSNEILVEFTSDVSGSGAGFSFDYKTVDSAECQSPIYVDGSSGVISSPYYPVPYENSLNCVWHISVSIGERIAVQFHNVFFVKPISSCTTDYLQIFDGSSISSKQFQHNFCGEQAPRGFLSSTNHLTLVFNSGTLAGDAVGFSLNWTSEAECASNLFQCWDGSCVDITYTCDGKIDCPNDPADEASCASTQAENECGKPEIAADFIWEHRIIGGSAAKQGSWPWQTGVLSAGKMVCSGVLISDEWVMTAAHCITKGYTMSVVLGDHNTTTIDVTKEQIITADEIYVHPKYNHHNSQGYLEGNDIALLHLSKEANNTKWVKSICLPTRNPETGETAIVTGWGRNSYTETGLSEVLRQVRLPVLMLDQCNKSFGELSPTTLLPASTICLGVDGAGMGACQGDSGGPAVILNSNSSWEVIGIISFSHQCGAQGKPTYLTSIPAFVPYLQPFLQDGQPGPIKRAFVINAESQNGSLIFPALDYENYPKYPQNVFYQWFINAPSNKRITIRFGELFNIEFGGEFCPYDYMIIYDGSSTAARKYLDKRFCGSFAPPDFESSSNSMIIEFSSDNSYEETGFSISWSLDDDCSPEEFRCWNKSCIPSGNKCDGNNDCSDGSDEILCALAQNVSTECGKAEESPVIPWYPLLVGGSNAAEGSWPWQIALFESGSTNLSCGATLISQSWVLTATHCIDESKSYDIVVGDFDLSYISLNERRISVAKLYKNPDYISSGIDDIALLELSQEVEYSKWIKPICLPSLNDVNPAVGSTCILTGWGITFAAPNLPGPRYLQQVQLTVLSDADCIDNFRLVVPGYPLTTLPNNLICAGHKHKRANACLRDSGGPLQCLVGGSWQQYGIVSFASSIMCGDHIFFERVSSYKNWIDGTIARSQCEDRQVQEGESGEVEIPTVDGKYPINFVCSWLLRAPANMLIDVDFQYFDVEAFPTCTYDYVKIYDGNSESSRKIFDETLCGNNKTIRRFESSSNELLITFRSDESATNAGFKLNWTAIPACQSNEFRCWDRSCIPDDKQCNGIKDCPNNRDEIECPHVNNVGFCGTQFEAPHFLWTPRINGGSYAVQGSWPWQVYIMDDRGDYKCGGSVVDKDWVLTAAHCTYFPTITVGIGGYNLTNQEDDQIIKVKEVYRHPNYVNSAIGNGYDIALFKLEKSITFGRHVQPICIATLGNVDAESADHNCIVTGWGLTKIGGVVSQVLRQVRLPIMPNEQCEKANGKAFNTDFLFCAGYFETGGADSCQGDSGGPLVCLKDNNWFQYGIVSYGSDGSFCGRPGEAGFYTTVTYYEEWIQNMTNGTVPVIPPPVTAPSSLPTTIGISENATTINNISSKYDATSWPTSGSGEVSSKYDATSWPTSGSGEVPTEFYSTPWTASASKTFNSTASMFHSNITATPSSTKGSSLSTTSSSFALMPLSYCFYFFVTFVGLIFEIFTNCHVT